LEKSNQKEEKKEAVSYGEASDTKKTMKACEKTGVDEWELSDDIAFISVGETRKVEGLASSIDIKEGICGRCAIGKDSALGEADSSFADRSLIASAE
jgi:hypothetical protein